MKLAIGVISDTHGLMRPEALAALQGSDYIVHAGDIGAPEVIAALRRIAPVTAVRGNNDTAPWARTIPDTATLSAGGVSIYVLHDLKALARDAAFGHRVIVAGHSHRPGVERRDGVLHVNPGSAGPRRFSLPVSVAHLAIDGNDVQAEIEVLALAPASAVPYAR